MKPKSLSEAAELAEYYLLGAHYESRETGSMVIVNSGKVGGEGVGVRC